MDNIIGSSPRLWGTPNQIERLGLSARFIPTPVGNTARSPGANITPPVHPHACGEHTEKQIMGVASHGSSPRLWGTRKQTRAEPVSARFIPTPVGNTKQQIAVLKLLPVHPHACGEHWLIKEDEVRSIGSSPRLWGTLDNSRPETISYRFIPTPVGNTRPRHSRLGGIPVHPHACGEHKTTGELPCSRTGSSPRLWGTREGQVILTGVARFIPTPVGNTACWRFMSGVKTVHPHACGEHLPPFLPKDKTTGSSPRLWGTLSRWASTSKIIRFIPTPVGNTFLATLVSSSIPVHPHACGEHVLDFSKGRIAPGSSPRLWGTL